MLRGDWDEVNTVTIYQPDLTAVHNVLELLLLELGLIEVECCQSGEYCYLPKSEQINGSTSPNDRKEILMAELLMQSLEGLPPFTLELPKPLQR